MTKPQRSNTRRHLVIRPAVRGDAVTIAALARELSAFQNEPTDRLTAAVVRRDFFGRSPAVRVLIAELDGQPAGYATLTPAYESSAAERGCYLGDLYVTAAARARGVGRALLAAAASSASTLGATFLWWCSKAWNVEAHAFYRKLGVKEEPVMAHALTSSRFAALAAEGATLSAPRHRRTDPRAGRRTGRRAQQ
ncbi:MAG: GNAT family N-acetyltransferase [Alphaproteobacteria bacterium]|nr:GNAT family N-acetyltransferase [Alphaproteobacteria bacterium]